LAGLNAMKPDICQQPIPGNVTSMSRRCQGDLMEFPGKECFVVCQHIQHTGHESVAGVTP